MVAENRPPPPVDSAGTSSYGRRRVAAVPPCARAGTEASTITRTADRSTTTLALLISHLLKVGSFARDLKRGEYSAAPDRRKIARVTPEPQEERDRLDGLIPVVYEELRGL